MAFDHLEWDYLWRVPERFGLGSNCIKMVKVQCAYPTARLITGNIFSSFIPVISFADDILLYIDNAPASILQILSTFEEFSLLSEYKIDWSKLSEYLE